MFVDSIHRRNHRSPKAVAARTVSRLPFRLVSGALISSFLLAALFFHSSQVDALVQKSQGGASSHAGHTVQQPKAVTNGLVAWYPMDGNTNDASGGNNPISSSNTSFTKGKFGKSLSLNGVSSYGSAAVTFPGNQTVSLWFNPTTTITSGSAPNYLLAGFSSAGGDSGDLFFGGQCSGSTTLNYSVYNTTTAARVCTAATTTNWIAGNWYHVVGMLQLGSPNVLTLYVNGVQQSTTTTTGTIQAVNTLSVGSENFLSRWYFPGQIDDVRVYSRPISAPEVTQLYQGSQPSNCDQTCVGWWKLDETSGTSTLDASGKGLTGSLTNFTFDSTTNGWSSGVFSNALQFNGSNNYMTAADTPLPTGAAVRTYSAWFRTATALSNATYSNILSYGTAVTSQGILFGLGNDANYGANTNFGISQYGNAVGVSYAVNDNQWHLGAATYDGTTWKIYVDGVLKGSKAMVTNTVKTGAVLVGKDISNNYWNGSIDDVRIYSRVLTDYELYDQYAAGKS